MITEKETKRISKFLSLVLRHQPELIGIELDENGWTDVPTLLAQLKTKGTDIDLETLKLVVAENAKQRFALNDTCDKIRANQGHSVEIDLGYTPTTPPDLLFHGTGAQSVDSILKSGLDKRERHHVHLSEDKTTASKVGQRHGKPVILKINAKAMHANGHLFYLSDNGVWLTDNVPAEFIEKD